MTHAAHVSHPGRGGSETCSPVRRFRAACVSVFGVLEEKTEEEAGKVRPALSWVARQKDTCAMHCPWEAHGLASGLCASAFGTSMTTPCSLWYGLHSAISLYTHSMFSFGRNIE